MRLRYRSALFATALSTLSSGAFAHGGFFRAYDVIVEPGNPDHMLLRSDVWGIIESKDGGQTFSWVCAEVFQGDSLSYERRSMVIAPGGKILVAMGFDGLQASVDGSICNFEEVSSFTVDDGGQSPVVTNVSLAADGQTVFVLTATGGGPNGVVSKLWRSTDGAETFEVASEIPGTADAQFSASALSQAPSDPNRLYVAGKLIGGTGGAVQRSDDGGLTWQLFAVPVTADNWTARIQGVDPNNPDVVYFWVDLIDGAGEDQLWVSSDAGATWTEIVAAGGDLSGFAFSPDGATVAVSGPEDGLLMAPSADVVAKGADAFTQSFDGKVWGLAWLDSGLFAGNDDYTVGDLPKFTYGVSTDDGKSFSGLLEICDVTMAECAADSIAGKVCPEKLNGPGGFAEDFINGPRCVGDTTTPDAGTTSPPPAADAGTGTVSSDGGGCSCRAAGDPARSPAPTWWGLTLAAALGLTARRRRARRPA